MKIILGVILDFVFPQEDLWRLFTDADRWDVASFEVRARGGDDPALYFDLDEPGYFHGMVSGLKVAMDFSRPLTHELIREIHDAAVEPVYVLRQMKRIELGWRKTSTWFYLTVRTTTPEGIRELEEKRNDERYLLSGLGNIYQLMISHLPKRGVDLSDVSSLPESYFGFGVVSQELIIAAVDRLIELYQEEVKNAKEEDRKIRAIARFVQDLNQAHPFFDGNIRTFGVLLLNRLLREQRLSLCCLSNPNCFDAIELDQLVELIKQGQSRFSTVLREQQ